MKIIISESIINAKSFFDKYRSLIQSNKIYSQKEMAMQGGTYSLQRAILMTVPMDKIDGLDPSPSTWLDDKGFEHEFKKGGKIKKPIELEYDSDEDIFYMQNGNHRYKQAKINGDKYILSFVQLPNSFYSLLK